MAVVTADKMRKVPAPVKTEQLRGGDESEQKIAALEAVLMRMIEQSGADKATKDKAFAEFIDLKTSTQGNTKAYLRRLLELTSGMREGGMDEMPGMEDDTEGMLSMSPVKLPVKGMEE